MEYNDSDERNISLDGDDDGDDWVATHDSGTLQTCFCLSFAAESLTVNVIVAHAENIAEIASHAAPVAAAAPAEPEDDDDEEYEIDDVVFPCIFVL